MPRPPRQASPSTLPTTSTGPTTGPEHPRVVEARASLSCSVDSRDASGSPWEEGVSPGSSAALALAHVLAWAQRELGVSLVQGVVPKPGVCLCRERCTVHD